MKAMKRILLTLTAVAAGMLALLCLVLTAVYVRPAESPAAAVAPAELTERFADNVNNTISRAMENLTYIRKIYRIPEGAAAPAPNPAGYGSSADPAEIRAVIDSAAELLDGQSILAWSEDTVLRPGSEVSYYVDESILALVWQEVHEDVVCTFCEVKLGDASQLRRKLSGDYYGAPIQKTASRLAEEDKAVVAINGDFYAFRATGIRVWQKQLHMARGWEVDSCLFTEEGDMLFAYRGELTSWGAAQRFVEENDITFSVAFGPVLVDNGVNVTPWEYPIGEIHKPYSRSVIGQLDSLHYLLMTSNFEVDYVNAITARTAGDIFLAKGCSKAYALDGGQTATLHLGGKLMCNPDFGFEREVSDILCFASAVPEGGTP